MLSVLPALSSFINQATADDVEVEHNPPADDNGSASPPRDVFAAHPFAKLQLSTSVVPGKHKLSTADKLSAEFVEVVVFWNNVAVPSAGRVASWRSDGGEFEVDSESHGLVLTSPDNLKKKHKC